MTKPQIEAENKPNPDVNIKFKNNIKNKNNKDDIANSINELNLIDNRMKNSSETAKTVSIEDGAKQFTSYKNPRVRKNILECVRGYDLNVELNFIRYMIYYNLNEHLFKFICPDTTDFINNYDKITNENKDIIARHEEDEDQDESWKKIPRKPKSYQKRKSRGGHDQVQGQIEKKDVEESKERSSYERAKRRGKEDRDAKESKDSKGRNVRHRADRTGRNAHDIGRRYHKEGVSSVRESQAPKNLEKLAQSKNQDPGEVGNHHHGTGAIGRVRATGRVGTSSSNNAGNVICNSALLPSDIFDVSSNNLNPNYPNYNFSDYHLDQKMASANSDKDMKAWEETAADIDLDQMSQFSESQVTKEAATPKPQRTTATSKFSASRLKLRKKANSDPDDDFVKSNTPVKPKSVTKKTSKKVNKVETFKCGICSYAAKAANELTRHVNLLHTNKASKAKPHCPNVPGKKPSLPGTPIPAPVPVPNTPKRKADSDDENGGSDMKKQKEDSDASLFAKTSSATCVNLDEKLKQAFEDVFGPDDDEEENNKDNEAGGSSNVLEFSMTEENYLHDQIEKLKSDLETANKRNAKLTSDRDEISEENLSLHEVNATLKQQVKDLELFIDNEKKKNRGMKVTESIATQKSDVAQSEQLKYVRNKYQEKVMEGEEKDKKIDDLERRVADKDEVIQKLETQMRENCTMAAQITESNEMFTTRVKQLESQIRNLKKEIPCKFASCDDEYCQYLHQAKKEKETEEDNIGEAKESKEKEAKGEKQKEKKKNGKKEKKNIVCSFYVKKKCIYGKRCRYLHEKPAHELDASSVDSEKKEREGRSKIKKKEVGKTASVDRNSDGHRSKLTTLSERSSSVSSISSVESGNGRDLSQDGGASSQSYRPPYVARSKEDLNKEAQRMKENNQSVPAHMREVQDMVSLQRCQDLKNRLVEMVNRNNEVMNLIMGELNQQEN